MGATGSGGSGLCDGAGQRQMPPSDEP
jgi:hypothetical protein